VRGEVKKGRGAGAEGIEGGGGGDDKGGGIKRD